MAAAWDGNGVRTSEGEREKGNGRAAYLVLGDVHHELDRGKIAGEGEPVLDQLEQRNARRPNVRSDGVLVPRQPFRLQRRSAQGSLAGDLLAQGTYRHVETRASKGACHGVDKLARDTEVAELHDAFAREEDVWRLDVAVDGLLLVQVGKALQDLRGETRQYQYQESDVTMTGEG